MARFQIPDLLFEGFEMLAGLKEEKLALLVRLIDELQVGISIQNFETEIYSKGILPEQNSSFAALIYSLGNVLLDNDEGPRNIADDLSSGFLTSKGSDFTDEEQDKLSYHLFVLLSHAERLKKTAKANRILSENLYTYSQSRVLTDIRLIFDEDLNTPHQSGLVIHHLKIEYQENNEYKSMFFTLKGRDLIRLRETLTRALEKEATIKNNYKEIDFIEII